MSLTVISNHPIETVSSWIKQNFQNVKDKQVELNYKNFKFPFPDSYLGKLAWMKAVSKEKSLYIIIPLEEMYSKYKEKPIEYINSFLQNQGNGTLMSVLKNLGLIYSMNSELMLKSSFATGFFLKFTLTKKGFNNQPLILQYFYQYVKLISQNAVKEQYYEQLQTIQLINFNFNENRMNIEDEVSQLSHNLNYYPTREIITSEYLYENYNESIIQERSQIIVSSNNFAESADDSLDINNTVDFDSDQNLSISNISKTYNSLFTQPTLSTYNKMFKLSYGVSGIPEELISYIENANTSDLIEQIEFKANNEYLKQDFTILKECSDPEDTLQDTFIEQQCFSHLTQKNFSDKIIQIQNNDGILAWFKLDQTFKIPKVQINAQFISPLTYKTSENYVLTQLLALYLNDFAAEKFQQAIQIGYEINFEADYQGLSLKVKGFREKIINLFEDLLKSIKNLTLNEERFKLIEEQYKLQIDDNMEAYFQGFQKLKQFIFEYNYDPKDLLNKLEKVEFSQMENFIIQFFQKFKVQTLIIGDIDYQAAKHITNLFIREFNFTIPEESDILLQKIRNYKNLSIISRGNNSSPFDQNQLVLNYYQSNLSNYIYSNNFSSEELIKFEAKYSIIAEQFSSEAFNYLRTEHQLGYIVSTQLIDFYGIKGIIILVQGVEENVNVYDQEIENFLIQMENVYENFNQEYFFILQQSAINVLKKKDIKFDEMVEKYWKEIYKQTYVFDRKEQTIKIIEKIKHSEIIEFFKTLIQGKLSIQLQSAGNQLSNEIMNYTKQYNSTIQNKLANETEILGLDFFII